MALTSHDEEERGGVSCFTCSDAQCRETQINIYNISRGISTNIPVDTYLKTTGCDEWRE
jgi:hypothetical protein